ncbi:MAG: ABC transporter ATP-binding protein [Desulfobacteraceae bacterium]
MNGLDLQVGKGELVAIVGASGSGKSVLAHAILGILPKNASVSGQMVFKGARLTPERRQVVRGMEIALIPQSVSFLDPLQRIGAQVRRAAVLSGADKQHAVIRQRQVFERYELPRFVERLFPFQLSGGMARRTLLAVATVGNADLLIADEPTPGLHPKIARESLAHLRELADSGKGILLITHDLEAARRVADKIDVFYAGTIVEEALAADFTDNGENLRHPFTRALWNALPQNGFRFIPGSQPPLGSPVYGCPFVSRCTMAEEQCSRQMPPFHYLNRGFVRCFNA